MDNQKTCINCGRELVRTHGTWLCLQCNSDELKQAQPFFEDHDDDGYVFIDCPGATLYAPGADDIIQGVKFFDDDDPTKGYRIIGEPVYSPTHTARRRIKKEALGKIRRCQGCQDYTIRMRRKEGPDFFIPSHKHPGRTKLKSVKHRSYV